ncbi:glycosyltransferase [Paenibacillus terreus]|uniref:Glycosyltransferase n=1 Tax=Paenibacillus terreus TaxID=1387834 RepID=A0ABV5BHP7_9BACL
MDKPHISLCMIVRNEEELLPKCLRSVQRIVDEIIIVDTGSTDETVAIAKNFGAKVVQMPWRDSFAAARNRSFDEAAGDWILWLDADEEMDVDEADKLKELLTRDTVRDQGIEGIQFVFCNYLEGGGVEYSHLLRMVRNRPHYRFEGRIHEQLLPNMLKFNPELKLGQADIHVYHYGYLFENISRKNKIERNISLLLQAIPEQPEHALYQYHLGVQLFRVKDYEGALRQFNVFLDRAANPRLGGVANAYKYKLVTLAKMGRYHDLVHDSAQGIALFPGFTDLYHLEAIGFEGLGEIDRAIDSLRKALSIGPAEEGYPSMAGHGTYLTYRDLGQLYASTGNSKNADLYLTLASLTGGATRITFKEEPDV